jgi:hypothetical protein
LFMEPAGVPIVAVIPLVELLIPPAWVHERVLELIIGVVAEVTPLTDVVKRFPAEVTPFELMIGCVPVDTPFTSDSKVFPEEISELELIKDTVPRETPFTFPVRLLTEELNEPEFTIFTEFPTPLVVLVRVLPVEVVTFVLIIGTVEPVTPFTVVERVLPREVFDTVVPALKAPSRSCVLATPFTVEVRLVPESESTLLFTIGADVVVTPFTVLVRLLPVEERELELIMLAFWLIPFTVELRLLPVEVSTLVEPARIAGVRSRGVLLTPFTVLVRFVPEILEVLVLIIFTGVVATPFTVVTRLLPVEVLVAELIIGVVPRETPFTSPVRVFTDDEILPEFTIGELFETTPFTVVVSVLPLVAVALVFTVLAVLVIPFTDVVIRLPVVDTVFPLTALEVATIPFTVEVRVLPERERVLVVAPVRRGVRSRGDPVTPFTVVVRLDPVRAFDTVVDPPSTPAIDWYTGFPVESYPRMLFMEPAGVPIVAVIPLVELLIPPAWVHERVLELIIGWLPELTPLTVEVNPFAPSFTKIFVVPPARAEASV